MYGSIISSLVIGLIGSGIGGGVVWLAVKQVIQQEIDKKLEPMWNAIDTLRQEYVSKEVCGVVHKYADRQFEEIKAMFQALGLKIDGLKNE